ncbi:hypothetical protein ACFS07_17340 [Undibacterium arcticum]
MSRRACSWHAPPKAGGEVTRDSGAKRLLLSHLSPTIKNARAAVEASIVQSYAGPTEFAQDGLRLVP